MPRSFLQVPRRVFLCRGITGEGGRMLRSRAGGGAPANISGKFLENPEFAFYILTIFKITTR